MSPSVLSHKTNNYLRFAKTKNGCISPLFCMKPFDYQLDMHTTDRLYLDGISQPLLSVRVLVVEMVVRDCALSTEMKMNSWLCQVVRQILCYLV